MIEHIFLYGPPGSGKSTVGRALATCLSMPFVDLDEEIQRRTGNPVARIMRESGEDVFRDVEEAVLREEIARPEAVIALGGGTLLRQSNRELVEGSGKIICLQTEPRVLLERLSADSHPRPLLAGNLAEQLAQLLGRRADHYDSFDTRINSDQSVEQICHKLQTTIGRFI